MRGPLDEDGIDLRVRVLQDRLPVPGIHFAVREDGAGGVGVPEGPKGPKKKTSMKKLQTLPVSLSLSLSLCLPVSLSLWFLQGFYKGFYDPEALEILNSKLVPVTARLLDQHRRRPLIPKP